MCRTTAWHIHQLKMPPESFVVSLYDPVPSSGYARNPCMVVLPGEPETIGKETALRKNLSSVPGLNNLPTIVLPER